MLYHVYHPAFVGAKLYRLMTVVVEGVEVSGSLVPSCMKLGLKGITFPITKTQTKNAI